VVNGNQIITHGIIWTIFDPETGECTMQLVKAIEHVKTLPHTGSVKQW